MPRLTVALIGALLLVVAVLPAQQNPAQVVAPTRPVPAFAQLQNWIQLSKTHRIGQNDEAVRALATWPIALIQAIDRDLLAVRVLMEDRGPGEAVVRPAGRPLTVRDLRPLFDLPEDAPLVPAIARILMRAAMMHSDLLMSASHDDLVKRLSADGMASMTARVDDGQRRSVPDLNVYWSIARTAMDIAEPAPVGKPLARDWYLVTSAYLLNQRDNAPGMPHIEHARAVLPGEARLALYLGALYENLAAPAIQSSFQGGGSAMTIGSRPDLLRKAEFQFRSALLLDPALRDTTLRLGRTLLLAARPDEALPWLASAESGLRRSEARYFAALFAGFAHAELGNREEARAAFSRASAAFPEAQSPRLGLAGLAMIGANRNEALEAIKPLTGSVRAADPWFSYDIDLVWNVTGPIALLRADIEERLR